MQPLLARMLAVTTAVLALGERVAAGDQGAAETVAELEKVLVGGR